MKNLALVLTLFLSFNTFAELSCSQNGTRLVYTNGINTSRDEAKDTMLVVSELLPKNEFDSKGKINELKLGYNYSYGFARDFMEVIVQKMPKQFLIDNNFKDGYVAYMNLVNTGWKNLIGIASSQLLDEINKSALEQEKIYANYLGDRSIIAKFYDEALQKKQKVIAISHSQGGLFMNDSFDKATSIYKNDFMAGFQVATPASMLNSEKFTYATYNHDSVINIVRSVWGALPPTIDLAYSNTSEFSDFFLSHGILTTYLNDIDLKAHVLLKLKEAVAMTDSNCVEFSLDKIISDKNVEFQIKLNKNPYSENITYLYDFGDGQTVKSTELKLNHVYSDYGNFEVSIAAQDVNGNELSKQNISIQLVNEQIITLKLNPKGTYLFVNTVGGDAPWGGFDYDKKYAPTALDLSTLGIKSGDLINIKVEGFYQDTASQYGGADIYNQVAAVFVDANSNYLNIGANSTVESIVTLPSYVGEFPTDIAQDFLVPVKSFKQVEVPNSATSLLFTVNDNQFRDNFDPNEDLYVVLKISLKK